MIVQESVLTGMRQYLAVVMLLLGIALGAPVWASGLDKLEADAIAGDPWAQLNLGAAYDHGIGIQADAEQAVYWYRMAAEQGLEKAQFNLAHCLATGDGTVQDYLQARSWMHRAAEQGMPEAQFLLGAMLAEGLGGSVDKDAAKTWLQRAADQGDADALAYLQRLSR